MAQVIVRNIEDSVKAGLKQRASMHGWSMEEEVREILRRAVRELAPAPRKLGAQISARFAGAGLTEALPELRDQRIEPMDVGQ